jgi:hypothetical protein
MATSLASGGTATERNIPASLIDEARRHVYEAAIRTPLVRLNYDGSGGDLSEIGVPATDRVIQDSWCV